MNDNGPAYQSLAATLMGCVMAISLSGCGGANDVSADAPAEGSALSEAAQDKPEQSLAVRTGSTPTAVASVSTATATATDVPGGPGVYVDSAAGSDNNLGTAASPWKTLAKLATVRLTSGQGIYLRCGSTWRESTTIDGRQIANGAVISGYGPCLTAKATITGADDFSSSWVKYGVVWQRTVPVATPKITRLFVNGVPQRTAQWPNYGGVGKEYAITKADMATSTTRLSAAAIDLPSIAGQDIAGATMLVKSGPWIVEKRTVASADASGNFTLTAPTTYSIEGGSGYILQDKFWMLNSAGEFFHDTARGIVFLWPSDTTVQQNLNAAKVEGSVRDTGMLLRDRTNLAVRHLAFTKTRADGLLLADTANAVVENIALDDNTARGVRLLATGATVSGVGGTVIRNSSFTRNGAVNVDASTVSNVSVSSNSFSDAGMSPNAGNAEAAISIGAGGLAEKNIIRRSAQGAIRFSGTGGTRVLGNLVEDACLRFSDCSAVMTWNGNKNLVNQSSLVEANTIVRVPGNAEGSVGGAADWAAGIYLDEFTLSATLRNNFIAGAGVGIMVHNASNTTVEYNRVALASMAALFATMDHTDADYMTGNVFRYNQWMTAGTSTGTFPALPTVTAPPAILFWHTLLGSNAIGSGKNYFANNEFALPNGTSVAAVSVRGNGSAASLTVQDWIRSNPLDGVGSATPKYTTSRLTMGPNLIMQGGFDTGLGSWFAYAAPASPQGNISLGSRAGCSGSCALMTSGSVSDGLLSPTFNLNAGGLYYLTYLASFANDGSLNRPGIGRAVTPFDTFATSRISTSAAKGFAGSVIAHETYFTATSSDPANLRLGAQAGTQVAFDNVSLRQVLGYTLAKVPEWVSFAYADPVQAKTVDCTTLGWPAGCTATNLSGQAVPLPTSLPAGSASVYLRADATWRAP